MTLSANIAPQPSPPGRRLAAIDALRGFAALIVLLPHSFGLFVSLPPDSWTRGLMSNLVEVGTMGVDIFFVLSGFVIAATSARRRLLFRSVPHFLLRRLTRIAPPYWVAIALMVACLQLQSMMGRSSAVPGFSRIAAHVFYVQEILGFGSINVVFWTLCLEVQFYLFFALASASVHLVADRAKYRSAGIAMGGLILSALLSVGLAFIPTIPALRGLFFGYWHEFALGILAFVFNSRPAHSARLLSLAAIGAIGVAAVVLRNWHMLTAVATSLLILDFGRRGILATAWSQTVPQYLGRISYSLYLVHVPVIFICLAVRMRFRADSPLVSWAFFGVTVLCSIIAAQTLYALVERPSMALSKRCSPV